MDASDDSLDVRRAERLDRSVGASTYNEAAAAAADIEDLRMQGSPVVEFIARNGPGSQTDGRCGCEIEHRRGSRRNGDANVLTSSGCGQRRDTVVGREKRRDHRNFFRAAQFLDKCRDLLSQRASHRVQ
ncbi:hypothetical protein D9M70_474540 [compost metagenome]